MPAAFTIEDMRQDYAERGDVPSSDIELEIAAMVTNEAVDSELERQRQFLTGCREPRPLPEGILVGRTK
jgi:predicted nucleotidyltransferase